MGTDLSGSPVTLGAGLGGKKRVARNSERSAALSGVLRDPDGECGRALAARYTPTMAVIDLNESLAYYGENNSDSKWYPISVNYAIKRVRAALTELKNGRHVQVAKTRAHCCSGKYWD